MSSLAITGIGTLVSGDFHRPLIQADTIIIKDKLIAAIGGKSLLGEYSPERILDAKGTTLAPGLIDSHAHVFIGDYTPRQNTMGFIEKSMNGGVTTMISAGEPHTPGRPSDPAGTKALAVLVHKSFEKFRPAGVKVHGGALILEKGLTEADFAELAMEGVWLVGEIGLGTVKEPAEAAEMVVWAKKHGFMTMLHTGGTSIPGSSSVSANEVLQIRPDVVSHLNGGPTAIPLDAIGDIVASEQDFALELVQCGNYRAFGHTVKVAREYGKLDKIILGNDSPSGTGVVTLGILRCVCYLACMCSVAPEQAIAMATGNTAHRYGLNTGVIAVGREADFVVMDAPLGGSAFTALDALSSGDLPGIGAVIIDGTLTALKSNTTPPPARMPEWL